MAGLVDLFLANPYTISMFLGSTAAVFALIYWIYKCIQEGRRNDDFRWTHINGIPEAKRKLLKAAELGETEVVREMLADGVDPNTVDNLGMSSLHRAAKTGNMEIVQLLLQRDADINLQFRLGGYTAGQFAAHYFKFPVLEELVAYGADIKHETKNARSVLTYSSDDWDDSGMIRKAVQTGTLWEQDSHTAGAEAGSLHQDPNQRAQEFISQ